MTSELGGVRDVRVVAAGRFSVVGLPGSNPGCRGVLNVLERLASDIYLLLPLVILSLGSPATFKVMGQIRSRRPI